MDNSRRDFIKKVGLGTTGMALGGLTFGGTGCVGANNKVRVGIVGFSNRCKHSLIPAFMNHAKDLNFEFVAVSDIWNRRRDEAQAFFKELTGKPIEVARNNEELYEKYKPDAVIISTADFQHALHLVEAIDAGCDAYVEKPFAETMEDARSALSAAENSGKIVQIGSQRRSGANYHAASDYIRSGKFGEITVVQMNWNVNQPGRWRLPHLTSSIKKEDTDWDRYLMNRPKEEWDPRKYLEYRLFWPYSSGIPGQWMCHQIDTVHWFSGFDHPRSVTANGGIYKWNDGRRNADTMTAVFDYGPDDMGGEVYPTTGFQVIYSSRQHNAAGGVKELYFSNGGTLNLANNTISPDGGLQEKHAKAMNMEPNLLDESKLPATKVESGANTGSDPMTSAHMRNWMECIRSRKEPHAPTRAGYNHAIAVCMTTAALRTGQKATFDKETQEVMAGGKPFKF